MNIIGIAWIGIVSDDPTMRQFYQHTLKLNLLDESEKYTYYQIDQHARLEILASNTSSASLQRADAPAIGFLVKDIERCVQELKSAGVRVTTEIKEWKNGNIIHQWVYFLDPEGNTLLLLERHGEE